MIDNFGMFVAYFLKRAMIACLMAVRKLLRCWCYYCLSNELNYLIRMNCKVEQ